MLPARNSEAIERWRKMSPRDRERWQLARERHECEDYCNVWVPGGGNCTCLVALRRLLT